MINRFQIYIKRKKYESNYEKGGKEFSKLLVIVESIS